MGATNLWKDDFATAGYQPYTDGLKALGEELTPPSERMYQGSMQKRIRDGRGTRYFVNVDFYDFSMARSLLSNPRSLSAHVQFSVLDEMKRIVGVSEVDGASPAEIEAFFSSLWERMGWGYYEVDDPDVAHPSPVLPALSPEA